MPLIMRLPGVIAPGIVHEFATVRHVLLTYFIHALPLRSHVWISRLPSSRPLMLRSRTTAPALTCSRQSQKVPIFTLLCSTLLHVYSSFTQLSFQFTLNFSPLVRPPEPDYSWDQLGSVGIYFEYRVQLDLS